MAYLMEEAKENYRCIISRLWKIIYRPTVLIVVSEHSSMGLYLILYKEEEIHLALLDIYWL